MTLDNRLITLNESLARNIITQLAVQAADRVESDSIEVKGWCNNARDFFEKLGEFSACLANANGGVLVLGVGEEGTTAKRFTCCPYRDVNAEMLSRKLNDVTIPPVSGKVDDISHLVVEITGIREAQAFIVTIPKSDRISGHMTAKGISKIRVGKECRPNFTAEDDRTNSIVPGATLSDLSQKSIEWSMSSHQRHYPKANVGWSSTEDFLLQLGFIKERDCQETSSLQIPLAALLLFGTEVSLREHFGSSGTVVKTPLRIFNFRKNIVESYKDLCGTKSALIPTASPQISVETLKELVMNAFIHRCYRVPSGVVISANPEQISIQSPGELAAGLNPNNLIYCVPVYRNLLLAEGWRFIGLCDKVGQGIDLVYKAILSEGFDFPIFESECGYFSATISLKGSANFKEFVRRRSQALNRLDEIAALRILYASGGMSIAELALSMQKGQEQARRALKEMESKLMIEIHPDGKYSLAPVLRADIENIFKEDQMRFSEDLFGGGLHMF